jgi:tripartite-type tricarboxylate transporter receptor subunit TctC
MSNITRRGAMLGLASLGYGAAAEAQAPQDFPNRPLRAVVPSPPGGPPDLILRIISPKLLATLGQPVVVDNRAGGASIVGTSYVQRQPPDGYTWLFTTASHVNTPPFNSNVPYDPVRDFAHVTMAVQNYGQALVVHPSLPATNLAELIALAKAQPGKLTYGNAGNGTASHIPAEIMKSMTGTDILSVPYRGVAEAVTDLLAARIDMFFVGTNVALEHVRAGRLRALGLTGSQRWKGMPEVPTMQEGGLAGFNVVNWFGIWVPLGTPRPIIDRIHGAVRTAVADPDVVRQFDEQGLIGVAMPPEEFERFAADQARIAQEIGRRVGGG